MKTLDQEDLLPLNLDQMKKHKMEEQKDSISDLPDSLLHHILSLLPTRNAIQTSTLSPKWRSIWNSYPILVFDQDSFEENKEVMAFPPEKQSDLFLNYLRDSIARRDRSCMIQKLKINSQLYGLNYDDRLTEAINFAVETKVRELDLSIMIDPMDFFTPPPTLYSAKELKILRLASFEVDINELMQNSPSIEEIVINQCRIPSEELKVSGRKLKKFEFNMPCPGVKSIIVDAAKLETFTYNGDLMEACLIKINSCKFLKVLSLNQIGKLDYGWLQKLIENCEALETLEVSYCYGSQNVLRISNENLKMFKLMGWRGEGAIDIDAPKLHTLVYYGLLKPFVTLNTSGSLEAKVSFKRANNTAIWHHKLPECLMKFEHCRIMWLVCNTPKDLKFSEELKDNLISPLCEAKSLKVEFTYNAYRIMNFKELVDTMLWLSPHAEMLEISYGKQLLIELQHEESAIKDGDVCLEYPTNCWKHHLKKVRILKFDENEDDKENLCKYFRENAMMLDSLVVNSPPN